MDEPIIQSEPIKKKRGWQKGRPRGPRKPQTPLAAPPAPPTAPTPFVPPEPTGAKWEPIREEPPEPVSVEAVLNSGKIVVLAASDFEVQNGRYVFTSYPAQRGFKRVTVLKADQLASLTVTAPERMAETLKVQPQPPQTVSAPLTFPGTENVVGAMVPPEARPIVYGPPLQRPPYAGGDPRRFVRDQNVERAATIPNAPGIPMAEISKGDEGVPETIRATMG